MMKKSIAAALLCSGLFVSTGALADNHTVSMGYAQSHIKDFKNLRGVNAQYRYEWDSPVSIIGSLSYMDNNNETFYSYINGLPGKADLDVKYHSILAGPAYRINDYLSLYGLVGAAYTKANIEMTLFGVTGSMSESDSSTSFAYAAGLAINPTDNLSVNVGYEGSRSRLYDDKISLNGFNIGVGYRF
jgi:putatice virulence related protein PagC